ncbi:pilus assembly FimT family protein [Vampirovibrio chlorellavorus]|uniref:pilus assembly FimT family protein n=1 Tax=Vampirovibrio chlorellavorus TaxID=758823 RepID=UPI0026EF2F9A|nr:type II secretion system protein [Vampirovibrio chlorellavorus]
MKFSGIDRFVKGIRSGFTLAELLVTLLILAEIFVFTIPKVLVTQRNQQYNARAKEVAGMITGAYQQLQLNGGLSAATKGKDLTPYMNFVSVDTTSFIDSLGSAAYSEVCNSSMPCLRLHGGGLLRIGVHGCYCEVTFWGTSTTNYIGFQFDPDGLALGGTNKDVIEFDLFYNGRLTTRGATSGWIQSSGMATSSTAPDFDPAWFSW